VKGALPVAEFSTERFSSPGSKGSELVELLGVGVVGAYTSFAVRSFNP